MYIHGRFGYSVHRSRVLPLLFHGVRVQALVPLDQTADQERPAPPEGGEARFVLRAAAEVVGPEGSAELFGGSVSGGGDGWWGTTYREADRSDQVPEADVPAQDAEGGDVPPLLRFEHEQRADGLVSCEIWGLW